ncbi:hypothetical protein M413DRAFT_447571 [Hebeloma cylindrosporum]|uniref:Uncharacterized protein n=1 Tax=Hebeloma cylindrosporum TaxID=76867 RepID=A0A0C3C3N3_HEBCY|nr:hypothetical protein M413DRAFT_447571 [Hebeloma cylindrosporum h7]
MFKKVLRQSPWAVDSPTYPAFRAIRSNLIVEVAELLHFQPVGVRPWFPPPHSHQLIRSHIISYSVHPIIVALQMAFRPGFAGESGGSDARQRPTAGGNGKRRKDADYWRHMMAVVSSTFILAFLTGSLVYELTTMIWIYSVR